jgi:acylphosphatase
VELVAEGPSEEVERFLAAVAAQMAGYIRGHKIQDEPPQGLETFEIRA